MSFLNTLLAGLILAAVSALTVVAYRHPQGYRKVATALAIIGLSFAFGRAAGNLGAISANIDFLTQNTQTVSPSSAEVVKNAILRLGDSYRDLKWTLAVSVFVAAYLTFLSFLPYMGIGAAKLKPEADS